MEGLCSAPDNAFFGEKAHEDRVRFHDAGYFRPCPPEGDEPRGYVFTIFDVDTERVDVDEETSGAVVGFMLHFHTIEKASVTYTYGR